MTKVIVTGGSGFVGQHTIKKLEENGHDVFNFDYITGHDICNYDAVKNIINEGDIILHLAALARVSADRVNPARTFHINVGGTLNIILASIEKRAKKIIHASSGAVYFPVQHLPITEWHSLFGNSVYGHSKALGEEMYYRYAQGNIPFMILRYGHLYGNGKTVGGIHNFIHNLKLGKPATIFGGKQTNDYTYVKDIATANLLAIEYERDFERIVLNIGTGVETCIMDTYYAVEDALNINNITPEILPPRGVDPKRFVMDVDKAEKILCFRAKYKDIKKGIKDMVKEQR